MRVLVTVPPALSHLFPLTPLAWALQSAGHDVLVASSGSAVAAATGAGLRVVDVSPTVDFDEVFGVRKDQPPDPERIAEARRRGRAIADSGGVTTDPVLARFATVSDLMAGGLIRAAAEFRPDLVLYGRLQGGGLLVARRHEVPAVEHGVGFLREGDLPSRYLPHLAATFQRHEVPLELPPLTTIQIAPPRLMVGAGSAWYARYIPYGGGGQLPGWLHTERSRPRVAVTLGTVVPKVVGLSGLTAVVRAVTAAGAEAVVVGADRATLGDLPEPVRVSEWLPLRPLLDRCDAVIHHGGAGSTLTALRAGLPQLALPYGADEFVNADVLTRHGLGLASDVDTLTDELVRQLLTDLSLADAARQAAAEAARYPAPVELVGALTALVR